jgi:hypothetical protein
VLLLLVLLLVLLLLVLLLLVRVVLVVVLLVVVLLVVLSHSFCILDCIEHLIYIGRTSIGVLLPNRTFPSPTDSPSSLASLPCNIAVGRVLRVRIP